MFSWLASSNFTTLGYTFKIINHGKKLGGVEIILIHAKKFQKDSFKKAMRELADELLKRFANKKLSLFFGVSNPKLVPIYRKLFKDNIVTYSCGLTIVDFESLEEACKHVSNL